MSHNKLDKQTANRYLYALAKEYRKAGGARAGKAELIIIGGASVMFNYSFRNTTDDIDALIFSNSAMNDAITKVSYEYDLPSSWINSDFSKTESYSDKLRQHAKFYKTFAHTIDVYTINAEYLIAMKLVSGRDYKKDLSDIVGILSDQIQIKKPITMDQINIAVSNLYGESKQLNADALSVLDKAFQSKDIEEFYNEISLKELEVRRSKFQEQTSSPETSAKIKKRD